MTNPVNERLFKVFDLLKGMGTVATQKEFCAALGVPDSHFTGYRKGSRNVSVAVITNLLIKYNVSPTYMLIGKGEIMGKQQEEPTPEQKSELERRLAVAEALADLQQRVIEEKNKEISYLRELLRLEVKKEGDKGS